MVARCRSAYPTLKVGLLANEGCLFQCPFKPAHDALIAQANLDASADLHALNRALGCMRHLRAHPEKIFRSPFIRPEDLRFYEGSVDFIKICGRTLGRSFLEKAVTAYIARRYNGNLLELLDALDWMADIYDIANRALPEDFLANLADCSGECNSCGYCTQLFDRCTVRLTPKLKRYKE
jgi:collagenase-like PrtC family protease